MACRRIDIGQRNHAAADNETSGHLSNVQIQTQKASAFPSNFVSTTKYELWNIVPKNLWEQFHRIANVWFLTVSIFQMLPLQLSPTSRWATLVPLSVVLLITFIKDAYEDYGRWRDDRRVNSQMCQVAECTPDGVTMRELKWRDVTVGSYVQLECDQPIPADMILLCSSKEDGTAYVDTAQLDGEASLKPKFALEETMRLSPDSIGSLEGHVDSEMPNELVQSYSGTLYLQGFPRGLPVDAKNFLLRGSTLRNTQWALGLVVFTGVDTKLVRNSKKTPSKRSRVEDLSNSLLLIVFFVLVLIAVTSAILRALYINGAGSSKNERVWSEDDELQGNGYLAIITFIILYNNLIPISLYVTTDLVRTFQARLMERDRGLVHKATGSSLRVRNSGLCENLGQVEFVLSDKTGTLTENEMRFKACAIGDKLYGYWDPERGPVEKIVSLPSPQVCMPLNLQLRAHQHKSSGLKQSRRQKEKEKAALAEVQTSPEASPAAPKTGDAPAQPVSDETIDEFFLCLATCHTAIVEEQTTSDPAMGPQPSTQSSGAEVDPEIDIDVLMEKAQKVAFRSASPDEEALVSAARDYGYFFRSKAQSRMIINVRGKDRLYEMMVLNEFTSERKRMSVLVRQSQMELNNSEEEMADRLSLTQGSCASFGDLEDSMASWGPPVLYVKGADNVMLERLKQGEPCDDVRKNVQLFSSYGLRTLVCAKRTLTTAEAKSFVQKVTEAKSALMHRNKLLEDAASEMERELEVLGVSAVEDRIQQGVPEAMDKLLRAGIKVWMLTGDNLETAMNIGRACRLLAPQHHYMLDATGDEIDAKDVEDKLSEYYRDVQKHIKGERRNGQYQYSVVLHGRVLYTITEEKNAPLRQLFLALASASSSVIACRLAPAQKAALVKMVRHGLQGSPLTLAIGDGGNDVSMIQEAHVGVGLEGVEGRQAANASDFVIGQFRFLARLLLVHGRWNLRRTSIVICYSFYKNFVLVLPMWCYAPLAAFSGTTLYDSWLLTSYNFFFTSLPIFIVGTFDFDVCGKMAMLVPPLYRAGVRGEYFNSWVLSTWILRGAGHAVVAFGTMMLFHTDPVRSSSVGDPDYLVLGSWVYWVCVTTVNMTLLLHTKSWMDWYVIVTVGSALFFIPAMLIYSQQGFADWFTPDMGGVAYTLFGRMTSWLGLFLTVASCSLVEFVVNYVCRTFKPTWADVLQEVQRGYCTSGGAKSAYKGGSNLAWDANDNMPPGMQAVEALLKSLDPPSPPVHIVKPEGGVTIDSLRSQPPQQRCTPIQKLQSVVPSQQDAEFAFDGSANDNATKDDSILKPYKPTSALAWEYFLWVKERILERQWTMMTVGELLGSLSYDTFEVPTKSFKGGLQQQNSRTRLGESRNTNAFRSEGEESRAPDATTGLEGMLGRVTSFGRSRGLAMNSGNVAVDLNAAESVPLSPRSGPSGVSDIAGTHAQSAPDMEAPRLAKDSSGDVSLPGALNAESRHDSMHTHPGGPGTGRRFGSGAQGIGIMYSMVTLRFFVDSTESAYRRYASSQVGQLFRKSLVIFCLALLVYNIGTFFTNDEQNRVAMRIALCVFLCLVACFGTVFLRSAFFVRNTEQCILGTIIGVVVAKQAYDIVTSNVGILGNTYTPVFIIAGARIRFIYICGVIALHLFMVAAKDIYYLFEDRAGNRTDPSEPEEMDAEYAILIFGVTLLSVYNSYLLELLIRQDFIVLDFLRQGKHKAQAILRGMFPEKVVDSVMQPVLSVDPLAQSGKRRGSITGTTVGVLDPIKEDRGVVSIVFCDIQDFDALVQSLEPTQLVQLLDLVWMQFDRACEKCGTTKIETVGKTYMAAAMPEGGDEQVVDERQKQIGALNAMMTALAMLEVNRKRVPGLGKVAHVSVRIGVHTGPVITGIVGSRKPQFALFGDTVNTASRMQSTGQVQRIHISAATYQYVKDNPHFRWEERKTEVKGKGLMDTYLLTDHVSGADRGGKRRASPERSLEASVSPRGKDGARVRSSSPQPTQGEAEGHRRQSQRSHSAEPNLQKMQQKVAGGTMPPPGIPPLPPAVIPPANPPAPPSAPPAPGAAPPTMEAPDLHDVPDLIGDPALEAQDVPAALPCQSENEGATSNTLGAASATISTVTAGDRSIDVVSASSQALQAPPELPPARVPSWPLMAKGGSHAKDKEKGSVSEALSDSAQSRDSRNLRGPHRSGERHSSELQSPMSARSAPDGNQDGRTPRVSNARGITGARRRTDASAASMTSSRWRPRLAHGSSMLSMRSNPSSMAFLQDWVPMAQNRMVFSVFNTGERTVDRLRLARVMNGDPLDRRHWLGCCSTRNREEKDAMKGSEFGSLLVSFAAFWVIYLLESIAIVFGSQGRRSSDGDVLAALRFSYLGVALIVGVLCKCISQGGSGRTLSALSKVLACAVFAGFVCSTVSNLACLEDADFWHICESLFFFSVLTHYTRLHVKSRLPVLLFAATGVTLIVSVVASGADGALILISVVYFFLISSTQLFAVYGDPRRAHSERKATYREHERLQKLLDSMLPREVLAEMKSGKLSLAYSYEDMTFLFADIVGFTQFCATHSAEQAVNLVTRLFAEFDETTVKLGVYKVCTIGDAYVCVNEPRRQLVDSIEDCMRVLSMANEMLRIIIKVRSEVQHMGLDMRIGLHCGRFVGGVIGTRRVRFDIYGEDVLIGNKVESEGVAGQVCVSESAKDVIQQARVAKGPSFTDHKEMELKSKKRVKLYLCEPPKDLQRASTVKQPAASLT